MVPIDQDHVTVALVSAPRDSSLDVVGKRPRFHRDRIAGRPSGRTGIALIGIGDEGDRQERLVAGNADVRDSIGRGTEVGVKSARRADPVDQLLRLRIDRRLRDFEIPPVVRRKDLPAGEVLEKNDPP